MENSKWSAQISVFIEWEMFTFNRVCFSELQEKRVEHLAKKWIYFHFLWLSEFETVLFVPESSIALYLRRSYTFCCGCRRLHPEWKNCLVIIYNKIEEMVETNRIIGGQTRETMEHDFFPPSEWCAIKLTQTNEDIGWLFEERGKRLS